MHLVVFKQGGLGDLLMAIPALRGLRHSFPEARISFIVGRSNRGVLENCAYLDELLDFDDSFIFRLGHPAQVRASLRLARQVRALRADEIFILHRDWRWNLFFKMFGPPVRYGFGRDFKGAFLTYARTTPAREHEIHKYQSLMGLKQGYRPDGDFMEMFPSESDRAEANEWVSRFDGREIVAIAPGGASNVKETRTVKRWPLDHYQALIEWILAETELAVLLVGGPSDTAITESLRLDPGKVMDLAGRTNVRTTYQILKSCRVMVTQDCGPMHIGAASGLPVISLFGPTDPAQYAPLTNPFSRFIYKGGALACSPCYKEGWFPDCDHQRCMAEISPEEVARSIRNVSSKGPMHEQPTE